MNKTTLLARPALLALFVSNFFWGMTGLAEDKTKDSIRRATNQSGEIWRVTNGVLTVAVSARDAGAVCSLVYADMEFVNDHDHGRQMQVAWAYNDLDEAYNPTEGGSGQDGTGTSSTSRLISVIVKENTLTTVSHPAFWRDLSLPERYRKNTAPVTQDTLTKTLTLGYHGDPHVIVFDSRIEISRELTGPPIQSLRIEAPTLYANAELDQHYLFDPAKDALEEVPSHAKKKDAMNNRIRRMRDENEIRIMSTADGRHAVTFLTLQRLNYWGCATWDVPSDDPTNACKKITTFFKHEAEAGRSYPYRTFVIVGDLATVKASVQKLLAATNPGRPEQPGTAVEK